MKTKTGYVDGFILIVPKKNVKDYMKIAKIAGKVWKEHGALDVKECMSDDMSAAFGIPFPKLTKVKATEVVFFSFITFKTKAHRNAVNNKALKDPRMEPFMDPNKMPFDCNKLSYGGFKVMLDLGN